jgi:hypothetical protein
VKTKEKAIKLEMSNCCEDWEWEDALDDLEHNFLNVINEDLNFYITGRNMTWRNLEGYMCKSFKNALEFCRGVFPDCEWNATFTLEDKRLFIRLSHHDSPTGEHYEVFKADTCDVCGEPHKTEEITLDPDGWKVCPSCKER